MKHLLAGMAILLSATAAFADDRASVGAVQLALLPDGSACRLLQLGADTDQVIRLPLAGLCQFHRDPGGALRVMDSPDGAIFLVETAVPKSDSPGDCDTQVLAVRMTANGPVAAATPARVASCPPFQWDDVMFLGAF